MTKRNLIISIIIIVAIIGAFFLINKGGNSTTYANSTYSFSISLPKEMQTSSFADGEGETVLITNKISNFQMQIYISSFDEDIVLTAERIKSDIPDIKMDNIGSTKMGGIEGISFASTNETGQKTSEIWFVKGGNLYQISTLEANNQNMAQIIGSWR